MAISLENSRVYKCGGSAEKNPLDMKLVKAKINDVVDAW